MAQIVVILVPLFQGDISKLSRFGLAWLGHYDIYDNYLLGPLNLYLGFCLLQYKEIGRKLLVLNYIYNLVYISFWIIILLVIILPQVKNDVAYIKYVVGRGSAIIAYLIVLYWFTKSEFKEQFK